MVKAGTDVLRFGADEYARLLFAETTDGVFFADAEGCYVAVNRSGHRLLGYEDGELVGRCLGDVVLESELPRLRAALSAVARGEVQSRVWSMLRKDGSVVALEVLAGILNRMAPMIRRLVGEHIRVELALAPKLSRVKVDVGSVEQVIMNLIVNARDAMPDGGKLTLETQDVVLEDSHSPAHPEVAPGAYTLLVVTDTGFGIGPEIRPRVFEPFFTTKGPGVGTGLGLAMCHGIVKQAGGAITLHSEPGNGSSFSIYLPSRTHAPSDAPVTGRPATASAGHETVLLVEDEPLILRVARTALEKLGYHVLCAADGIEALEIVGSQLEAIDLLLTDVVMPRLGGRELARRLQSLRPSIKVLYTSGYAENAIATDGVLREGVNFIQKPYALATLAKRVREVLDQA